MKSREKHRANRRAKNKEAALDKRNGYGAKDLTAYNAVKRIRSGCNAAIALK